MTDSVITSGQKVYFRKADILKLFKMSPSQYNDLTRDRPRPKISKKTIFGFSFEFDKAPFFTPLDQDREGSGKVFTLILFDLMLLYILNVFRRQGINRSLGKYIKQLIISARNNPEISPSDRVWTEEFSRDRNTSGQNWNLTLILCDDGQLDLQLMKGAEIFHRASLFQDPDIGLVEIKNRKKRELFPTFAILKIDLEFINSVFSGLLRDPEYRANRKLVKKSI